jgi:glycosyltransferase involved in cell wall biosynthesis
VQYREAKRYLQDILNIEEPDVIHVHNFPCIEVLGDIDVSAPIVRTIHSYENQCENQMKRLPNGSVCTHPLGEACQELCGYENSFKATRVRGENRYMKKRISRFLAISSYVSEVLLGNGFPKDKITILPNFTRLTYQPSDVIEQNIVLYVGRLTPEKGLLELIESLKLLKLSNMSVKLLIVGKDGALGQSDFQDQAIRRASDAGIEVEALGWLVGDKLRQAYVRAKVVAFSSMWPEPFGLVGIEAMAQGKPVVAFDCGGIRQWLEHERTGFVVPHGDVAAYAERIRQLLTDDILRAEMGARARTAARENFSSAAYIDRLLGIYTEVLNESSADRSRGCSEIRDAQCGIGVPV